MLRWMLDRNVVGQRWASMGRIAMGLIVPALMAGAASCGSSGDDTPIDPGTPSDASADVPSDTKGDTKTDGPDGDGGPTGCVPETCETLEANCGTALDGCGAELQCGECTGGDTCGGGGPNKCGTNECVPKSCVQLNASCGLASDTCAAVIDCGGCPLPSVCGAGGQDNQCGCSPKTCAQLGANCGTVPDGCFGVVDCGNCVGGQACGGGGPNQCGSNTCSPKTCSQLNASCGFVSDGCSKALDCGECGDPNICGGGGIANQCGCTPKSCSQLGASCGTVDNGCASVNCGECTAPDTCGGGNVDNLCGCLCTLPNAVTNCQHGDCSIKQCTPGWGNCDANPANGCETDLRNSVDNCGACGAGCSFGHASASCQLSKCELGACDQDYDNCDGDDTNGCEANLKSDPTNCNTCSNQCPAAGGTPVCATGVCGVSNCDTGRGDCDPNVAGCETDTTSSVDHCGFCDNPCGYANATGRCVGSACQLDTCDQSYGDCDLNETNGCEINTDTSVANCGSCDNACPTPPHSTPTCAGGSCGYTCVAGWADCDGQAGNGCEVNTGNDTANCGACGTKCSLSNATAACSNSTCVVSQCSNGFADCNGVAGDGCEVNTTNNTQNCGGCGQACSSNNGTASCSNSTCGITCNGGYQDCDGQASNGCEVNLATDANNCGGCGAVCSNSHMASRTCSGGTCDGVCANGFGDCDVNKLLNGCESDLNNSPSSCGGCGVTCSSNHMQTVACGGGICNGTCSAGYDDCDGNKQTTGCEVNLNTDPLHCGSCINVCSTTNMASVTCGTGTCNGTCAGGYSDCDNNKLGNGCETSVATDVNNCGSCGTVCSSNNIPSRACSTGTCTGACSSGYSDCDGNKQVNGCEVNLTNDPSHCGNCATNCAVGGPNVASTQCLSSACQITACSSGYYNQNTSWADGCECGTDSIGNICGSPTSLGTIAQGSTSYFPSASGSYNITPTGGTNDEDWFTVTFNNASTCNYRPRIELQDLSGTGLVKMNVYQTGACGAATQLTCNASGESGNASSVANLTTWEFRFSGTCGDMLSADPFPVYGAFFSNMINSVSIRVYTNGPSTTCLPYRLMLKNAP